MSSLSVCMIIKDEEKYLKECLLSVKNAATEIILVDTGSEDNSIQIAKEFNCKIFYFPWNGNFSDARNFALKRCTQDWILYIDADERLQKKSLNELGDITSGSKKLGIYCTLKSQDEKGGRPNMMKYIRLFRNDPSIHFKGRVHEQIIGSLKDHGYDFVDSNIELLHVGYDISLQELQAKAQRNLQLLLLDYADDKDAYTAFQIGSSYGMLNEKERAAAYFHKAVQSNSILPQYIAHSYRYLAAIELEKRNFESAVQYINSALHADSYPPLVNLIYSKILFNLNDKLNGKNFFLTAYRNNKDLLAGRVVRPFEIMIAEEELIIEGLTLAVQFRIHDLFDFLQREYKQFASAAHKKEFVKELLIYDKLFNNKPLNYQEIYHIANSANEQNLQVYISFLEQYQELMIREDVVTRLNKKFPGNPELTTLFSEVLEQKNDLSGALEALTRAYESDKLNIVVFIKLIALLVKMNHLEETKRKLENAELDFMDNSHCQALIQQVKTKLKPLLNGA